MKTAVCTINYGTKNYTIRLLKSLNNLSGNFEVYLLENGSPKNKITKQDLPKTKYKINYFNSNVNLGFAGGCNLLLKKAFNKKFDYFWLLNSDATVKSNSLAELLSTFNVKKDAGLVESVVLDEQDKVWWAGGDINLKTGQLKKRYYGKSLSEIPKNIYSSEEINGAAMLIKKEVIQKIGYMDDSFFHTVEDSDYSIRALNAGFGLYVNPKSVILHAVSKSSGGSYSFKHMYYLERARILFMKKYNTFSVSSYFLLFPTWVKRVLAPVIKEHNFKASYYAFVGIIDGIKNVTGPKNFK